MEIIEIPKERISEIESLWCELNELNHERSKDFKDYFSSFTFSDRSKKLLENEDLAIFAANVNSDLVGYCIAECNHGVGEVESLYVNPIFQGSSFGLQIVGAALSWLRARGCNRINVSVSVGNEEAIPFYEKLGFKKRLHILQINNS